MTYGIAELHKRFPEGTIGNQMEYIPELEIRENLFEKLLLKDPRLLPRAVLKKLEKAIVVLTDLSEDGDSDEVLREFGYYDSNDPRSCINRKKT